LTWHGVRPVTTATVESSGLIARDGMYYCLGQVLGGPSFRQRTLSVLMSPDFENWTDACVLGFRRDAIPPRPTVGGFNAGPQVHLGAAIWDRGNVLLGLYGQWDGDPRDEDRRYLKMNLGLVITHDGMHFTEPVPDFKMIKSIEENWSMDSMGSSPRIVQGQGFINHGEQTITYFGHWGKDGNREIRAAVWDRDRLGQFGVNKNPVEGQIVVDWAPGREKPEEQLPYFISAPIVLPDGGAQVSLNVNGFREDISELRVAVVDRNFKPIAGYTLADCESLRTNSFRLPVKWKSSDRIKSDGPVRLRLQWGGKRFEDPIVYAVYVTP
jgi:hypothetical protein